MKRYFRIILINCLILFVSSCNIKNMPYDNNMKNEDMLSSPFTLETQAITEENEYYSDLSNNSEPSRSLYFDSMECYHEFIESEFLENNDFELYIRKNNFHMNGILKKEDVTELNNEIKLLPVPTSTLYKFVYMVIDVDHKSLFISYQSPDGEGCTFLIYFNKNDYLESLIKYNYMDQETGNISMNNNPDIQSLYVINDDEKSSLKAYLAFINGYDVLVRTYNMSKESILHTVSSFTYNYHDFISNMK